MKREGVTGLAVLVGLAQLFVLGLALYFVVPPSRGFVRGDRLSTLVITDRNGVVLREVRSSAYGVTHWVGLEQVSPWFCEAVVAAEDRRFYRHHGVDLIALVRAAVSNLRAGRIVSGGSTITQQLVRSLYLVPHRNLLVKLGEVAEALRFEMHLSKRQILEAYVNRIPFGNQAYGIDAAAELYFDRSPTQLSLAQSCFLAAIPRSPSEYDPYRRSQRTRQRQRWILGTLLEQGKVSRLEYEAALAESIVLVPPKTRFRAPHFVDMVLVGSPKSRVHSPESCLVRTTLDRGLQQRCEDLLESQLSRLSENHVTNGAVLVLDRQSGDVLAMVGSRDYFCSDAGQVNACLSPRQPGSATKPFVYALAFEHGLTPATILPDLPGYFSELAGDYVPRNYDQKFHGPVSCRTALACSYNVPAVRLADEVGPDRLLEALRRCGMKSLKQDAGHYGLALALGVGEVPLIELTNGFRVLANYGEYSPVRATLQSEVRRTVGCRLSAVSCQRVFGPQSAYLVTDILSDNDARAPAFGEFSCLCLPFPCAVKTGTSKDYRDNWTVGYTADYVVGVWVGNFDGSPMHRVSGVTGAGPLFRDVMLAAQTTEPARFGDPPGITRCQVCPKSGGLPGRHCPGTVVELFAAGAEPKDTCRVHQLLRVNPQTGELASDTERAVEQVFEVYPSEYWAWMADNGMPLPPASLASNVQSRTSPEQPAVLFPDEDDVFKIDPDVNRQYQSILLKGVVPANTTQAAWVIDGRELAQVGPPFTLFWNLEPGKHRVRLEAAGHSSEEISFLVLP